MVTKTYNRYLTKQKEDVMALIQIRRKWVSVGVWVVGVCCKATQEYFAFPLFGKHATGKNAFMHLTYYIFH